MQRKLISTFGAALIIGFAQGAVADVSVSAETKTTTSTGVVTPYPPATTTQKLETESTVNSNGVVEHETTQETHTNDGLNEKHEVTKKTTTNY